MLNLIVSPKTQNKKAEKTAKYIIKFLKAEKMDYSVYFSLNFDNMTSNLKELQSFGETEYVVIGDDQTLSHFINNIKDISKIKLGIIPTGKHNDFANYLGISNHPAQAIKDIISGNIQNIDLMLVNEYKVLNNLIIGASVEIEEKYSTFKLKNAFSYNYAKLKYGHTYQGIDLVLSSKNSKQRKTTAFELIVANGGLSKKKNMSPLSNMQDGLFNLLYCDISSKKENGKYLSKLFKSDHIYDDNTYQYWMNDLTITSPHKNIKANLDGRTLDFEEIKITLVENGLKIMKNKS